MKKLTKKHKKIIFNVAFWSVATFLFLSAAALLILWASGYKYNFQAGKFEKTGLIYLVSKPKKTKIYLNNKLVKEKTPARLGYILPGKYKVEIKKKGYLSWSKEIEVSAGKVTRFEDIVLFLENPESSEIAKNTKEFHLSPDKEKVLYFSQNLNVYNFRDQKTNTIETTKAIKFLQWSDDSEKILFKNNGEYFVYELDDKKLSSLKLEGIENPDKILWHPKNSEILFVSKDENLYSTNLQGKLKLLGSKISNFTVSGDGLVYILQTETGYVLQRANFELGPVAKIVDLKKGDFEILAKNSHVALKGATGNLYAVVDNDLEKINSQVQSVLWSEISGFLGFGRKTKLLYKTNLDGVWFFDPEDQRNSLVTRTEKEIDKILWYLDLDHVIFSCNSKIKMTELDGKNEILLAVGVDFDEISLEQLIYLDQNQVLRVLQIRE